ncbi:leucine-rich repeat protein [Alistipes senegalensis]|uniref:leucine-rich repeat protein n=1 Tax=Alistipes senegalensis TaxID=1288121 RepID=UPI0026751803|nr:leucine-rich repeat protein [Alistipes senegalensis]
MQKLLPLLMCVLLLLGCSDKYDDSALRNDLNDLENRVAKLEDLCKQMNTNISSLQTIVTALQNNVYVTGTTPLMKDGKEIGYTITFSKGNPITIYHGKDGQDGEDGTTPTIGVKKDTDGVYYWTLNGEFIVVDDGKIQAEGKDGTNGTNGTTPQFKIENDYWFVSYDNGTNWTQLGKATGEDGVGSDSMFSGVDYETSTDYIIFTLSNGTQIKLPTWSAFEALQRLCNETNTNLSALQTIVTALQNNDYITSVDPLTENGKVVGYTIKFAKSNPIVIYNGKDGADGNTPVISVKKDTDGIYYWTLDGEFIVVDGQKIKAQGTDGNNGADGSDGVTPKLEIREGYWWISYDNGTNWSQLGKATGEDGKDADSIKITQDENNVYFELADGTVITISKTGQSTEFIQFKDLEVKKLCCLNWDTDHDNELSYQEAATIVSIGTVFKGNTTIVSFNEFQYFNGITDISNAFQGCTNLWEITLPDNLSTIGDAAFANCKSLNSIILPENIVSIGDSSFISCPLSNITIPINTTKVGASAFRNCSKLGQIKILGNIETIDEHAFENCFSLQGIELPQSITTIGISAFKNCTSLQSVIFAERCNLTKIAGDLSNSQTYLQNGVFYNCTSLTSITIPANVEIIEATAFMNCKALSTLLFEPNSKLQIIGGNIHAEALKDGYGKLDAYGAFTNCTLLTSIQIPISVIEIECAAFYNCTSLNSVIFEEGAHINTIGGGGIYPYYGESYGGGAFSKCISLQSIDIPQSITKLEAFAFSESGLKSIYIRALTPPSLTAVKQVARDSYAYAQFPSGCTAYVPFETFDTYKDNKTWSSRAHIVAYNY